MLLAALSLSKTNIVCIYHMSGYETIICFCYNYAIFTINHSVLQLDFFLVS